jgi:hypothetical protein
VYGTQSTYLILIGDPGTMGPSGISHNVGNSFNLAAQTELNILQSQGHLVIACRVSSVDHVYNALTMQGLIDGGVIYFGHSGRLGYPDSSGHIVSESSNIFVGQSRAPRTNIDASDVSTLAGVQTANAGGNSLGGNAAFTVNGCEAGFVFFDALAQSETAIAQLIANNLKRGVYAYNVGVYFSQYDAQHDPHVSALLPNGGMLYGPSSLPDYMVPDGAPRHKPDYIPFRPR